MNTFSASPTVALPVPATKRLLTQEKLPRSASRLSHDIQPVRQDIYFSGKNASPIDQLVAAAGNGDKGRVSVLLDEGVEPTTLDGYGNSALSSAAENGHLDIVQQFIPLVDIDQQNTDGFTALHKAASSNHPQVVQTLLQAGANPNIRSYGPRNAALHNAAAKGYTSVVQVLLNHQGKIKTDIDLRNEEGLTALNRAALANHPQVVQMLLEAGADPNVPTYGPRNTALHNAALKGYTSVVQVLLNHQGKVKTNIDADNRDGLTALHLAATSEQPQVVKMLLDAGADPNVPTYDYRNTALHSASAKGYTPVVQVLVDHPGKNKTNINAINHDRLTALNRASINGHIDTVDLLLRKRANYELRDNRGHSPLANAVYYNHLSVVKRLLAAGADPASENNRYQTPLSRARQLRRNDLIPYLENPSLAKQEYEAQPAEPAPQAAKVENPVFRTRLDTAIVKGASDAELDLLILNTGNIDRQNGDGFTPLLLAAMYGRASALRKLLAAGAQRNLANGMGDTPLAKAAFRGDLVSTQILLDAGADMNKANRHGDTPLINAAKIGAWPVVDLLIARGAKLDEKDESGFTALNHAVSERHPEVVKRLLKAKADPNIISREGFTPLNTAASKGFEEIVDILLDAQNIDPTGKKVEVDIPNKYGDTALLNAISHKHRNIARKLLEAKANPSHANGHQDTPLGKALHANDVVTARLLIQYKANPNSRNAQGNTPLISAALTGNEEIVDLLLASGAKETINSRNRKGFTALHSAAFRGFEGVVAKLLLLGANADIPNEDEFSPLNSAVSNGRYEVARLLLQHGVKVDKPNKKGFTPLSNATFRKNRPMVELLTRHKADPSRSSKEGFSLLHTAVESGSTNMVESAARTSGANINVRDKGGNTPLINAAFKGRIDIVRQLLAMKGIQADCTNLGGYTALGAAVKNGYIEIAELLLKHGVKPDISTSSGDTPIMQATYQGNDKMVALLLEYKAQPDIPNLKGFSPLITASGKGYESIVRKLLATKRVNVEHSNIHNETALMRALAGKHETIARLLLDAGASPHALSGSGSSSVGTASRLGLSQMTRQLIGAKPGVNQALLRAVMHSELPVMRRLLQEEQADINTVDSDENTPLHLAVETKNPKIVEEVLKYKPDLGKLNSAGVSAVEMALKQGQSDIIDLLQQYSFSQSHIQKRQSEIARGLPSYVIPSRKRRLDEVETDENRNASKQAEPSEKQRKYTESEIRAQIREQYKPQGGGWVKKDPPNQGLWFPRLPSPGDEEPFKIY
jgi:ankyrin repeat protein